MYACMFLRMYVRGFVGMCACVGLYVCMYIFICTSNSIYVFMVCTYVCKCLYRHVQMSLSEHKHMCNCMYSYVNKDKATSLNDLKGMQSY